MKKILNDRPLVSLPDVPGRTPPGRVPNDGPLGLVSLLP